MTLLDLSFASGEDSLSVRRVQVHEAVSSLYTVAVWAVSVHHDIDLEALVGQPAALSAQGVVSASGNPSQRRWSGVVGSMEQVQGVAGTSSGEALSTYSLRIVPRLWLLTHRQNYRIFQHVSIPDITNQILGEWGLSADWKIDPSAHPKLEYKVQYGESDFAFLSRLWEETGLAYTFVDDEAGKVVTLGDQLHTWPLRPGPPLQYADVPNKSDALDYATKVRLSHEVRPGAHTLRDYDFRRPSFALFGDASVAKGGASAPEDKYEQYHYRPHGFLDEGGKGGDDTPVADDKGTARHRDKSGTDRATRALGGDRLGKVQIALETNVVDLWPGRRFSVARHPHVELDPSKHFLVTEMTLEAAPAGEWRIAARAVQGDVPYLPALRTPKPKIKSVQSATVTGPAGQEIYPDEFGRVRVQFPWDREGKNDENSSCWIRVSQGWAGTGYGMIVLPRIGHEVLVGFLDGDPDAPVIVGRVFNATEAVPYKLPDHKTRSTWKSDSSLGSNGFNEIMFEDLADTELVYVQAQKNLRKLVKNDETITVGNDRQKYVIHDEIETTGHDRTEVTSRDRTEITDRNRMTSIGKNSQKLVQGDEIERTNKNHQIYIAGDQDLTVVHDRRERIEGDSHLYVKANRSERIDGKQSLTVGQDQQEQVGNNHALKAGNQIHLKAGSSLVIEAPDITLHGAAGFIRIDAGGVTIKGDLVRINSGGGAGSGAGSHPDQPDTAIEATIDQPTKPEPDNVAITGLAQ